MSGPTVSVIVPARNEEACLGSCLESLVTQTGIAFEVIVVDDASTDRTAEIARSFAEISESRSHVRGTTESRALPVRANPGNFAADCERVIVISAPPLPENWTGKNNAMSAGARIARGKWLLFTDADTVHKSGSLARAVAEAEEHDASLLSYSPEQEVRTFLEKAVMPVIFSELAAAYPPKKVNDPASSIAAANGQYLLISREAYDAVGGHINIANDLLEDVAMARLVKSSGRRIFFRYGGDAVRTRMYRSWPQMKEGWTKNLALLFPNAEELAIVRLVLFAALPWTAGMFLRWSFSGKVLMSLGSLVIIVLSLVRSFNAAEVMAFVVFAIYLLNRIAFPVLSGSVVWRARKAGFPWKTALVSPFGLPVFCFLLLRSKYFCRKGRLDWKDRTYIYGRNELEQLKHGLPSKPAPGIHETATK